MSDYARLLARFHQVVLVAHQNLARGDDPYPVLFEAYELAALLRNECTGDEAKQPWNDFRTAFQKWAGDHHERSKAARVLEGLRP